MRAVSRLLTGLAVLAAAAAVAATALASSHSEAPGTSKDRLTDDTDLYAWVAADAPNAVTFVGNWVPLLEPNGGPNFYAFDDDASYYINVDNTGDCAANIRYEFKFRTQTFADSTFLYNNGQVTSLSDPNLVVRQFYTLTRYVNGAPTVLVTDAPVAPNFVGPVSMPAYESLANSAIQTLGDGTRVFVGPRDDPFFVDLGATFDLLTIRRVPGNKGKGVDGVSNYNVMSIVLQVPKTQLSRDGMAPSAGLGNHVIGIWDSAERPSLRTINADGTQSHSGAPRQVSRLGMPLVNEVVIARQDKDKFNAARVSASSDLGFAPYVLNPELAKLFKLLYNIDSPPPDRGDLVTVFLTGIPDLNDQPGSSLCEMLRLNMTIAPAASPNRFGILGGDVAGFPNGRRLTDDVVDIEERVVAGATPFTPAFNVAPNNQLGDGVDSNDKPFLPSFPYVAPPHNPLDARGHREEKNGNGNGGRGKLGLGESLGSTEEALAAKTGSLAFTGKNPAPASALEFAVATRARVTLKVYDVQGREVRTLVDQDAAAGTFRANWDGRGNDGVSAGRGVYFARLTMDGRVADQKKVVLE